MTLMGKIRFRRIWVKIYSAAEEWIYRVNHKKQSSPSENHIVAAVMVIVLKQNLRCLRPTIWRSIFLFCPKFAVESWYTIFWRFPLQRKGSGSEINMKWENEISLVPAENERFLTSWMPITSPSQIGYHQVVDVSWKLFLLSCFS